MNSLDKVLLELQRQEVIEEAKLAPTQSITFGLITVAEHESYKVKRIMDAIW